MAVQTRTDWATFVQRRKFTKEEYYRMAEMGFFDGQRVELIDGEVVVMSPQGTPHWTSVWLTVHVLERIFRKGYVVRSQAPLDLEGLGEPEPDVAVVPGVVYDYQANHPKGALLIVEVAETSLDYDRTVKASMYARAQIPEYWVLNLVEWQLEVFREPIPMENQPFGWGYRLSAIYKPDGFVSPLAKPRAKIKVADLLPKV